VWSVTDNEERSGPPVVKVKFRSSKERMIAPEKSFTTFERRVMSVTLYWEE
jgi:hypothetical protein